MRRGLPLLAVGAGSLAFAVPAFAGIDAPARAVVVQATRVSAVPILEFVWPAQGIITTPFYLHGHDGIDIASLRSSTIRAAAPGVVEATGYTTGYAGYGNIVLVRVSPTMITLYAHLSSCSVKPGDTVNAGQAIGIAGCTGICYGTHLHFEVRISGTPADPMRWLS